MPAHRLPWVKLWIETLESDKVRELTDKQYRTWTYALIAGSQQTVRWKFTSIPHVAYVTRRSIADVRALVAAHFLDVRDDGVWIHDAAEYQDVFPSQILRDRSNEAPWKGATKATANTARTLREESAEHYANGAPNGAANTARTLAREGEGEGDRDGDGPEPPNPLGARGSRRRPSKHQQELDELPGRASS